MMLVRYLSKEGKGDRDYYDDFFSHSSDFVTAAEVQGRIDKNHRTLKRMDDKFYMLSINPSRKELQHLIKTVTGRENIKEFDELSTSEKEAVIAELKNYARTCMDEYALNFYREKIKGGDDLVYYGRVETERHYKGDSPEVKAGAAKSGDRKPGLNLHVHVIVSRMDRTQTVSLSPLSKSRGNRQMLDGKEVVVGFNRSEWAERCASSFKERYHYDALEDMQRNFLLKKQAEEKEQHYRLEAEMMRSLKWLLLQGNCYYEMKFITFALQTYRFVVNMRAACMSDIDKQENGNVSGRDL